MPIVFEEVTAEVEPTRASSAADPGERPAPAPSPQEMRELLARHWQLMDERCQRGRAD